MKKFLRVTFISLVVMAVLVGCSSANDFKLEDCKVSVGLVTDTGGVDDKSFNQSAWEGVKRYAADNSLNEACYKYLQSDSDANYVPNLSQLAEEGYDIVMAIGYLFQESIDEVSAKFPDTKFLFVDSVSAEANVMSAVYAAEQGSYLVGVAAGLRAKADGNKAVGFLGGMEGELIGAFQAGFEQGVLAVFPEAEIYVDYAASFSDDTKGQQLADKQYDAGVTIIYQAAGAAGNGVIKSAKERGDVWAIGVDKDQFEDGKLADGKSIILTSMIKRVDESTYYAIKAVADGTFKGDTVVFDLTNDGVGAELTEGRNLTAEEIKTVQEYAAKIKNGEIKVSAVPVIANGKSNKQ